MLLYYCMLLYYSRYFITACYFITYVTLLLSVTLLLYVTYFVNQVLQTVGFFFVLNFARQNAPQNTRTIWYR